MLDAFVDRVTKIYNVIPFSGATWFVLGTLLFFVWLFAKASRSKTSLVNWEHLIVDSSNDRASPYKVGYLIGIIVSTWIILTMADTKNLGFDMLGMYLTFLATGAGINTFAKNKVTQTSDTTIIQSTTSSTPTAPAMPTLPGQFPPGMPPTPVQPQVPQPPRPPMQYPQLPEAVSTAGIGPDGLPADTPRPAYQMPAP